MTILHEFHNDDEDDLDELLGQYSESDSDSDVEMPDAES